MNEWIISFANLEHFYSSNPARRFQPRGRLRRPLAARPLGRKLAGSATSVRPVRSTPYGAADPLLVLGVFPIDPDAGPCDVYYRGLDQHLEGWPEQCGGPDSLAWLIGKMTQASPDTVHTHLFGHRDERGAETSLC